MCASGEWTKNGKFKPNHQPNESELINPTTRSTASIARDSSSHPTLEFSLTLIVSEALRLAACYFRHFLYQVSQEDHLVDRFRYGVTDIIMLFFQVNSSSFEVENGISRIQIIAQT